MDIFNLLSYINKVSLLAFFVTILVVAYQIYVLKKEKTKEKAPSIPDFKDIGKSNEVVNYTRLPGFLTKKNKGLVNYSKLVFLIISLLTIMVVIFVLILIKQNSSLRKETLVSPTIVVLRTPTLKPRVTLSPSPTVTLSPSPTTPTPSPTDAPTSPSPTEIILAQTPSLTPTINPTNISPTQGITNGKPQSLPETGSIEKGLLIIGVAISTIFFSFFF
ncbi:MAG: hypothetical protein Q7U68_00555 [Candidatus Roizmanbacteria bacterium]|nr:hypothetical protein [Candidatus Roizmanbacteria bacterium]